jgi:hypothetical protein
MEIKMVVKRRRARVFSQMAFSHCHKLLQNILLLHDWEGIITTKVFSLVSVGN